MMTMVLEDKFEEVIAEFGEGRQALLPCLKVAQREYGSVPRPIISFLSERLKVAPLDIYSVISFYGMLSTRNQGKYAVRVCSSLPCHLNHADPLLAALKQELGIGPGETTEDKLFSLDVVGCLGLCDRAPAMLINDQIYGPLTAPQARAVIMELKVREEVV